MAEQTRNWALERGFELFAPEGARSVTLTCVANSRGADLAGVKKRLDERGFAFDDGYGKIKGQTFRVAHMGDLQPAELEEFLALLDEELAR